MKKFLIVILLVVSVFVVLAGGCGAPSYCNPESYDYDQYQCQQWRHNLSHSIETERNRMQMQQMRHDMDMKRF